MNAETGRGRDRSGFGRIAGRALAVAVIIGIAAAILVNRQWIYDWWRGRNYTPSSEMAQIKDDLDLTERGKFLFDAAWPKLSERDEFNDKCREDESEIAILGCYTHDDIYVYNITDERLDGIREVTAAHELLHAVYARMSESEKAALKGELEQVYSDNREKLSAELDSYVASLRAEELYVRAGTEIANLPEALERHYGEVFEDQDKIAGYYGRYVSVFNSLAAELESLAAEMEAINSEIEQRTASYEQRIARLDAEVESFNSCASQVGCFQTEAAFNARRAVLLSEQAALESEYYAINSLIDQYNAKVEKYNDDVMQNQKLNTIINSNSKPEAL